MNPLRKLKDDILPLRWSRTRQPNIQLSFCCPPNIVRTIAEAQNYIYGLSRDTLWVHLYGASALDTGWSDGGRIVVRQETAYPWSGAVTLRVDEAPDRPIALKLRIPGWCRAGGSTLAVNGVAADAALQPGTYCEVKRTWKPGDTVELKLDFSATVWEANPLVEETLNQVAVKYGPLVYCLESADLPAGVNLENVALTAADLHRPFATAFENIAGQSVLTLSVPAEALARDPSGALYRPVDAWPARPISLKLVPYFAWGNRGDGDMTVWLPVR